MPKTDIVYAVIWSAAVSAALMLGTDMGVWAASGLATVSWFVVLGLRLAWQRTMRGPQEEVSPWQDLNLDEHQSQVRLQMIFERYGITGSMNVRDGRIYPVVQPDKLSGLVKRLRGAVSLVRRHKLAGADLFYFENGVTGLADLTIMEVEAAASVIERVEEDRRASRKLYKGYGADEITSMARTACAHYIERLDQHPKREEVDMDAQVLSRAIRRGDCDDHQFVKIARATVELILKIKGVDA